MRHAPPVSVLCQSRAWRWVQAGLYAAAAATFTLWLVWHGGLSIGWCSVLALAVGAGTGRWAWVRLAASPLQLQWDGAQWLADREAVAVRLMLLADAWALLRLQRADTGPLWLAVGQADAGVAWHSLRVALLAPPRRVDASGLPGQGVQEQGAQGPGVQEQGR